MREKLAAEAEPSGNTSSVVWGGRSEPSILLVKEERSLYIFTILKQLKNEKG